MARSNTDLILEILRWQLVAENSRIGNIIDPKERLARRQETAIAWHVIRQKEPNPSELTRLIERFVGTDEMMRCGVEFPALRTLNLNQLAEDITIIFDSPDSLQQPDGDGAVRADPDSGIDSEGVDVLQESFLDGTERPQRVRRAIPFRLSLLDGDHTPDESVTSVSPDANYQRVSIPIPATPTRTPEPERGEFRLRDSVSASLRRSRSPTFFTGEPFRGPVMICHAKSTKISPPARSNRAKLLILQTHGIDSKMGSLNNAKLKMLPPSLKASEIKRIMKEQSADEAPATGAQEIAPKPRKIRRKNSIMGKDESPRSGLRPQHTHSTVRSQSVYGLLSTNKIQAEYRKLSDFGLLPPSCAPVSLTVPHSAPASPKDRMEPALEMPSSEDISQASRSNRSASPPLMRLPSLDPPSVLVDDDGTLDPELLAPIDPNSPSRTSLRQKIRSLKINGNQAVSSFRRSIRFNENATVRRFQTSFRRKKTNDDETRSLGTQSSVSDKDRRSMSLKRGSVSSEDIKSVVLEEVYDLQKEICSGRFGYAMEAVHKASSQKIALKFFPKTQTKQCDFLREYTYSYFLSPHPNIIDTYEGTFSTNDDSAYFFVQEACPGSTLRETVEASRSGIGDDNTRKVIMSVLSAIEYMHDEGLAHRNLKAENILIFGEHFEKVKVSDFGLTRRVGSNVKYLEFVNSYQAPELCETVQNEVLTVGKSMDIWAIGILLYFCLKARFPWQKASIMCKPYWEWEQWLKGKNPALPRRWLAFSEKTLKVMKKTLNPREKDRWTTKEIRKIVAKERLLKPPKPDFNDDFVYVPSKPSRRPKKSKNEKKKKSALQQWLCATLHTMSEISEQMVSARDDDE